MCKDREQHSAFSIQQSAVREQKAEGGTQMLLFSVVCRLSFVFCFLFSVFCSLSSVLSYAQDSKEPITVNGDVVEYSTNKTEVTASGNVSVIYKSSKLTCEKLTLNTVTKDALATGNVRLDDSKGVIEGKEAKYNFQNKTGVVVDSVFRSNPYFGKVEKLEKSGDTEYIAYRGLMSTCGYEKPHYRIQAQKINFFPQDKIQTKNDVFYAGNIPLIGLPRYNHSLKDPFLHTQVTPGKRKEWGPFLLTASRYNLTDNINGRIYFDYRDKLGVAEGFGTNYDSRLFGKGDFKYYYTQERSKEFLEGQPAEFQRYLVRQRHKWDIDEQTNFISEYYRLSDEKVKVLGANNSFLRDYFFREYEKDSQPFSYISLHRSFGYSSADAVFQPRVNHWFDQVEKLPELKYSLPSYNIAGSPFYLDNSSSVSNFNKKGPASTLDNDITVARFDTTNKFSLPMRLSIINLNPFVGNRATVYDKGEDGISAPFRSVFLAGAEASTKFYRIFYVKSGFLGMEINGLRHIVTPSIKHTFNHEPTIANSKLKQIDSVDSLTRDNSAALELSNKLQTKRGGQTVDVADIRTAAVYAFKPKTGSKRGSQLSDILFDMKFLPYSWLWIDSDVTFQHSGLRDNVNYKRISNVNFDVNFDFGGERSIGIGERYQRKGGKEFTFSSYWRLTPKWKFEIYERYQFVNAASTAKKGLKEQQYTISRDLHCWDMQVSYNIEREKGETVWFVLKLKAFPELEFDYNKSYHAPKPGSQSNP